MTKHTKPGGRGQRWSAINAVNVYRDRILRNSVVADWLAKVDDEVGQALETNLICCPQRPWPDADIFQNVTIHREDDPELFRDVITLPNDSDFHCVSSPSGQTVAVGAWRCRTAGAADVRQATRTGYQVLTAYAAHEPDLRVVFGLVVTVPRG
jgi:hypothetical protein